MANQLPVINGVGPSRLFLPEGNYPNLLTYLVERYPNSSAKGWEVRMLSGRVLDGQGRALDPQTPYIAKQHIYYYREVIEETRIPFEEELVYQDDFIVVADKPHYLPVSPVGPFIQETLLVRLRKRLGIDELSLAHRLDLETAGLVLLTKQPDKRSAYQNLFRDQQIDKYYEAIAPLNPALGFPLNYRSRIEESADFMQMQEVVGEPNSETRINLLEENGVWGRYLLEPITGKKHQLRAHMNALGIPIKNDQIYPTLQPYVEPKKRDYSQPLQLLAKSLKFTDPCTGLEHHFESKQHLQLID